MNSIVLNGDCLEVMQGMTERVDAVVTDPPYGLKFMGKDWDHGIPGVVFWVEALRLAKPGCHLLAFGGTRTFHRLACAIEDAGWEIRDTLMWVYGSGFPKSHDVSKAIDKVNGETGRLHKFTRWMQTTGMTTRQINDATGTFMGSHYLTDKTQPAIPTRALWARLRPLCGKIPAWVDELVERIEAEREVVGQITKGSSPLPGNHDGTWTDGQADGTFNITAPATNAARQWEGWGTALKPAWEPIIVARKPIEGTVAQNVLKYGTGALNIDKCRIGTAVDLIESNRPGHSQKRSTAHIFTKTPVMHAEPSGKGRLPANLIHDGSEEVLELFPIQKHPAGNKNRRLIQDGPSPINFKGTGKFRARTDYVLDSGSAARFFYCAKASRREREMGCEGMEVKIFQSGCGGDMPVDDSGNDRDKFKVKARNHHPTVKPLALMRYLCRLVTPPGGLILDPFAGSGTTGMAAKAEGFRFIGIEKEAEYCEIAEKRISAILI